MDYMGTEQQRGKLIRIGKENDRKREEERKAKYSIDVFNKQEIQKEKVLPTEIDEITDNMKLVVVEQEETVFTLIVKFFKNLFKIKD